jgi:predicted kinase
MKDCLDLNKSQTSRRWSRYLEDGKLSIRVAPEKKRELQRRLRKLGAGYSLTDLILFALSLEDAYLKRKSVRQLAADIDEMKRQEGKGPQERDTIREFLQRVNNQVTEDGLQANSSR